jgi:hypothetical protein
VNFGGVFEVASSYHYATTRSYKTQVSENSSPQFWYYNLSSVDSELKVWDAWFACGNASESYDLYLDFQNNEGHDIAKLWFHYSPGGTDLPTDYMLGLYYWDPGSGWLQLATDYPGGQLYNDWYRLRIEKNTTLIDYLLYRNGKGLVDSATGSQLTASFSSFTQIQWSSPQNPVQCPMFFWDEHTVELITIS